MRKLGFTIVELLVVIAIIAVLMMLLLAVVGKARETANRTVCQSNLRQLAMALNTYANSNREYYPALGYAGAPAVDDWIRWQSITVPDARMKPMEPGLENSAISRYTTLTKTLLTCPSDDGASHRATVNANGFCQFSYSMNQYLGHVGYVQAKSMGLPFYLKRSQIRTCSEIILLIDEDSNTVNDSNWSAMGWDYLSSRHDKPAKFAIQFGDVPDGKKRGNVVFVDGHTDYVSRQYAQDHSKPNVYANVKW